MHVSAPCRLSNRLTQTYKSIIKSLDKSVNHHFMLYTSLNNQLNIYYFVKPDLILEKQNAHTNITRTITKHQSGPNGYCATFTV